MCTQQLLIPFLDYQGACLCLLPSRNLLFSASKHENGAREEFDSVLPLVENDAKYKSMEREVEMTVKTCGFGAL